MSKLSRSYVARKIGQVSNMDRIVSVNAEVSKTNPFMIDDGSGKALVNSSCTFKEGDKIRVIGCLSVKENGDLPEIDPIAIQEMNKFDFDLYNEMQQIKSQLNLGCQHEK